MATRRILKERKPSLVPPAVAAAASLVLPGLGQALAGQWQRGLTLLGSLITLIGLYAWRVHDLGRGAGGFWAILGKALQRRPMFAGFVLGAIALLWLWTAWDAYKQAQPKLEEWPGASIFFLVLIIFFVLGWQIGEIDLYKAVVELPDAWPPLSRVLWPWEAAVERETESVMAEATVLIPCDDLPPPEIPTEVPGEPYIKVEPTCGDLSAFDEDYNVVPGTTLLITGRGFGPNTETDIWWIDPIGNEFRQRQEGEYVTVVTDDQGAFQMEITIPHRAIPPSSEGRQFWRLQARQTSEVGGLKPSDPLRFSIERMVETIVLGMMATIFGILFSIPVSFLAARNLMAGSKPTMALYYITRTVLNIVRSIEPLIWALIAVIWVGLGPFAGIIALTLHSIAALGKLYSEAIEGIDPGPIEAIQATGATRLQTIMYAVIPQMIPPFVSFSIYRWDINVRMSTVIGLVGGGGIGFLLIQYIRLLNYRAAGIAVWFIAITVALLDYISSEIRAKFV
ncbi:MAG: phosphonate ABC transporter, permease protein PhnE [Chloroflexia bacterium]|nr:phosphonate ABC transporter, permease protein PhnE [Chloroflexia bacterium]